MRLTKENVPFTQVANAVLCDPSLSAKAKGIYAYLFSRPADWQFSGDRICQNFVDGRKAIFSGLRELEEAGYLIRRREATGTMTYHLTFAAMEPVAPKGQEPVAPFGKVQKRQSAETGSITNKEKSTNKERVLTKKAVSAQPDLIEAPNGTFPDQELEALWNEWRQHLKDKRRPQSPTTVRRQVAKLRGLGAARAKAALAHSMECGYTGIFERHETTNTKRYPTGNTGTCHEGKSHLYKGLGKV